MRVHGILKILLTDSLGHLRIIVLLILNQLKEMNRFPPYKTKKLNAFDIAVKYTYRVAYSQ